MSLAATSIQLSVLLHDEDVKVIALSGKWGTGKSHLWREVQNAATNTKIKTAAIVSLFGLSSIEQVKLKLIQSAAIQGEKDWRGKLKDASIPGLAMLEKVHKGFGLISDVSLLAAPTLLKDKLIVLDDIERKHEKLQIDEILGFIDEFTQRVGARFLLILNSDRLKNRELWESLREKVVDHELKLTTSCDEAFAIATSRRPTNWSASILKAVQRCEITNIRILDKIIHAVNKVVGPRQHLHEATLAKVVPSTVLLAAINHRGIENGPDLSFILGYGAREMWADVYRQRTNKEHQQPETEEDRIRGSWRSLLSSLGISNCDEFELVVCEYLQAGLVGDSPVAAMIDRFEIQSEAMAARSTVHALGERCFWDHRASDADLLAVAAPIVEKAHLLDAYTVTNLHDYLDGLAEGSALAEEAISRWRAAFEAAPEPGILDPFLRRQVHPAIRALVQPSEAADSDSTSVLQALTFMSAQNGWNPREEMILKGASIDTFESIVREAPILELQVAMAKMLDIASNEETYKRHFGDAGRNFVTACQRLLCDASAGSRLARLIRSRFEEAGMAARLDEASSNGDVIAHVEQ